MSDCIFCKIVAGEIPCNKVYETETVLAFRDIAPMAAVHIVVIPKAHAMQSAADVDEDNAAWVADCFKAIAAIAKQEKLDNGFRVITNSGADAGQTVPHLHFHILGGEKLPEKLV
jgi:histidine triad (HIT) family protein